MHPSIVSNTKINDTPVNNIRLIIDKLSVSRLSMYKVY